MWSREPAEDCEFALIQARNYWRWKDPSVVFDIKYADEEYPGLNAGFDYCPVGSLEFCLANLPGRPKPLNVPPELVEYAGRIVLTDRDAFTAAVKNDMRWIWVKSADEFKHPANGRYMAADFLARKDSLFGENGNVQMTTEINLEEEGEPASGRWYRPARSLVSEWRCFVFRNELLDCRCYAGRWDAPPNEDRIRTFISAYSAAPVAYTLDVYVYDEGWGGGMKTGVMEVHDFFACGLYGFDMPDRYPFMCSHWFSEWKRRTC